MIVDESTREYLFREATYHCSKVWPDLVAFRETGDQLILAAANVYLGHLKQADPLIYNIVMEMISKRSGTNWAAIRDSQG